MGFTMVEGLDVTNAAQVLNDAWFARLLALSAVPGNPFYNLEIRGLASGTILGATATADPPCEPGGVEVERPGLWNEAALLRQVVPHGRRSGRTGTETMTNH